MSADYEARLAFTRRGLGLRLDPEDEPVQVRQTLTRIFQHAVVARCVLREDPVLRVSYADLLRVGNVCPDCDTRPTSANLERQLRRLCERCRPAGAET